MSRRLSLRDREVDALAVELENAGSPDLQAILRKLKRDIPPIQIPGQVSLEDYPEVFDHAA